MSVERFPRRLARRNWRRALYGDWSWIVRDPLDVLRLAFVAGTVAFALLGRSTAVGLTAASALLLVCRMINLPRRFDFAVIAAMGLIAWGTALGLYGDYYFYDNLVHGIAPFFYAPVLYIVLVRLEVLVDPERTSIARHHLGVFISTLALGIAVGAGYEVIEWLSDSLLGTHFIQSIDDTGSDLLEDTLGSCAGAALVTVWSLRGWSTRRAPLASRAASRLSGGDLVRRGRKTVGAWARAPSSAGRSSCAACRWRSAACRLLLPEQRCSSGASRRCAPSRSCSRWQCSRKRLSICPRPREASTA